MSSHIRAPTGSRPKYVPLSRARITVSFPTIRDITSGGITNLLSIFMQVDEMCRRVIAGRHECGSNPHSVLDSPDDSMAGCWRVPRAGRNVLRSEIYPPRPAETNF